jgi:hypothetical protein
VNVSTNESAPLPVIEARTAFAGIDVEHVEVQRVLETGADSVHGVEKTRDQIIPGAKEEPGDQVD